VALTNGFSSTGELSRHFTKHASKFANLQTEADYFNQADVFLGQPKPSHVRECQRKKGDVLRFDPNTNEYGVLSAGGVIRTYFSPVPCLQVPATIRQAVKLAGECHVHPDNLRYFLAECSKH
jgi:pyocin large subunit-like protein